MTSQGKVKNFSEIRKSFFENSKWKKKYQNFDKFQKFLILTSQKPGKKLEKVDGE